MRPRHRLGNAIASRAAAIGGMIDKSPFALNQFVKQPLDAVVFLFHIAFLPENDMNHTGKL